MEVKSLLSGIEKLVNMDEKLGLATAGKKIVGTLNMIFGVTWYLISLW